MSFLIMLSFVLAVTVLPVGLYVFLLVKRWHHRINTEWRAVAAEFGDDCFIEAEGFLHFGRIVVIKPDLTRIVVSMEQTISRSENGKTGFSAWRTEVTVSSIHQKVPNHFLLTPRSLFDAKTDIFASKSLNARYQLIVEAGTPVISPTVESALKNLHRQSYVVVDRMDVTLGTEMVDGLPFLRLPASAAQLRELIATAIQLRDDNAVPSKVHLPG
ncbi:MAG: hypothetical protein AAFV53_08220 [Myxococcota bacterium]